MIAANSQYTPSAENCHNCHNCHTVTPYIFSFLYLLKCQSFDICKTIFSTPYRLSYMEWRISYRVEYLLCHDQIQVLCEFFHRRVLLHKKFQNFILGQNLAHLFLVGKAVGDAQFAVVKT